MLVNNRSTGLSKNKTKDANLAKIGEILGLLEESGKGKDWILQEMKKQKIKRQVRTLNSYEMLKSSPPKFISYLSQLLRKDVLEGNVPDINTLTRTFHWFFTDIVGSANPNLLTKDQARKVWALNELIGRTATFVQMNPKSDVMTITGDGMVIGFADSHEKPLRLAIELHKILSKYNQLQKGAHKLRIRIGIESGPVYFIKDLTGKENFWGSGIIMARRVMDLARPMQILTSARVANDIKKLSPEYKSLMHHIGDYKIKHGEKLSIVNVYGEGWGNKLAPPGKVDNKKESLEPRVQFHFPKIEIRLEITNPKSMVVHHTWIWNMVNITEEPLDNVSYFIEGDIPRDFADLNATVRNEANKKLKILSVDLNKPTSKQFIVKIDRPFKPNQKRRFLKLEYDWEETERHFSYTLSTECKKFSFVLTAPKAMDLKPRVLKVDPGTRYKIHADPPAEVKYLKDKTQVAWQSSNLSAYDSYRFEW